MITRPTSWRSTRRQLDTGCEWAPRHRSTSGGRVPWSAHRRIARSASAFCGSPRPLPRVHLDTGRSITETSPSCPTMTSATRREHDGVERRQQRRGRQPLLVGRRAQRRTHHGTRAGQPSGRRGNTVAVAREDLGRPGPRRPRRAVVRRSVIATVSGRSARDDRGRDPRIGHERRLHRGLVEMRPRSSRSLDPGEPADLRWEVHRPVRSRGCASPRTAACR